jgi:hypothetical protein
VQNLDQGPTSILNLFSKSTRCSNSNDFGNSNQQKDHLISTKRIDISTNDVGEQVVFYTQHHQKQHQLPKSVEQNHNLSKKYEENEKQHQQKHEKETFYKLRENSTGGGNQSFQHKLYQQQQEIFDVDNLQHQTYINENNNNEDENSIFKDRNLAEEERRSLEAAHDLLSLSQSLPPLSGPCIVTIFDPENNFNSNSDTVQEIIPNYNGFSVNSVHTQQKFNKSNNINISLNNCPIEINYQKSTSNLASPAIITCYEVTSSLPLTPPTSEHSDTENSVAGGEKQKVKGGNRSKRKLSSSSSSDISSTSNTKAELYTYEDLISSDGRSRNRKKEKLKPASSPTPLPVCQRINKNKYNCPECGKQYATSSNLSRHKQTHRSLDSQSAKKCNSCGKAYVSMPALVIYL